MTIHDLWQNISDETAEAIAETFINTTAEERVKVLDLQKTVFYYGATCALNLIAESEDKKTAVADLILTLSIELGTDGTQNMQ